MMSQASVLPIEKGMVGRRTKPDEAIGHKAIFISDLCQQRAERSHGG